MFSGVLQKMTSIHDNPIRYILEFESNFILMNQAINKEIHISKKGYCCLSCSGNIEIFANGFCKKCFFESPKSGDWVMRPELSKAHLDQEDRDLDFEKEMQLQPHILYFSMTSGLKVGVTRVKNMQTRWIDQGAHRAIVFAKTPNRYLAGMIEKDLSQYISDRTYWRKMLLGDYLDLDLNIEKHKLSALLNKKYQKYLTVDKKVFDLEYPKNDTPEKIKPLNFDKINRIEGILSGIKGQYLFINNDSVLNIRKFTGYHINFR